MAFIVTKQGVEPTEDLGRAIQDFVKSIMAPYKFPRWVKFMDELPKDDALVKSPKRLFFVIPAKAGIQSFQALLDSRLRGSDGLGDFLRGRQR